MVLWSWLFGVSSVDPDFALHFVCQKANKDAGDGGKVAAPGASVEGDVEDRSAGDLLRDGSFLDAGCTVGALSYLVAVRLFDIRQEGERCQDDARVAKQYFCSAT